jgi:hypothetical protein
MALSGGTEKSALAPLLGADVNREGLVAFMSTRPNLKSFKGDRWLLYCTIRTRSISMSDEMKVTL